MDGFLTKPYRPDQLLEAVSQALSLVDAEQNQQEQEPAPAQSPVPPEFDSSVIRDNFGDRPGLMADVVNQFFDEENETQFTAIRKALREGNRESYRDACHTLKGLLRTIGAMKAGEAAFRLEKLAATEAWRSGSDDLVKLAGDIDATKPLLMEFLGQATSA